MRILATDPGRVGERIDRACRSAMSSALTPFSDGPDSDLPADLLEHLRDLAARMTAEPGALGGGSIAATSVLRGEDELLSSHGRCPPSRTSSNRRSMNNGDGSGVFVGIERFAGCFARLDRAVEHRDAFAAEWAEFLADHPYEVFVEVDDDGRGVAGVRRDAAFPPRLQIFLGEFLYELRAALDNCLYEVAVLHTGKNPPPGHGVLQFPTYDDPESWARNLYRLKCLSDEHRQMLERIQPYQAERQDLNCLAMLNRLARSDRHRTPHLIGACVVEGGLMIEAPPGSTVTALRQVERPVIHERGEIATFQVTPWSPGLAVGMQPQLVLEVEIAEMALERPWGSLSRRMYALHKAVAEYVEVLAAYALGYTEPDPTVGGL